MILYAYGAGFLELIVVGSSNAFVNPIGNRLGYNIYIYMYVMYKFDMPFGTALVPNIEETLHVRLLGSLHISVLKFPCPESSKERKKQMALGLPEIPFGAFGQFPLSCCYATTIPSFQSLLPNLFLQDTHSFLPVHNLVRLEI